MTATRHPLQLRAFCAADAPAVASWFEDAGLTLPPPGSAWAARLVEDPRIVVFVAEEAGRPVGFLRLDCGPDGLAELTMVVCPAKRAQGRGSQLFALALPRIRALGLRGLVAFVELRNDGARRFFERRGFCAGSRVGDRLRLQRLVHAGGPSVEPLDVGV